MCKCACVCSMRVCMCECVCGHVHTHVHTGSSVVNLQEHVLGHLASSSPRRTRSYSRFARWCRWLREDPAMAPVLLGLGGSTDPAPGAHPGGPLSPLRGFSSCLAPLLRAPFPAPGGPGLQEVFGTDLGHPAHTAAGSRRGLAAQPHRRTANLPQTKNDDEKNC